MDVRHPNSVVALSGSSVLTCYSMLTLSVVRPISANGHRKGCSPDVLGMLLPIMCSLVVQTLASMEMVLLIVFSLVLSVR